MSSFEPIFIFDAFYEKHITSEDVNLKKFTLSQWLLTCDFNLKEALEAFPCDSLSRAELVFMQDLCRLTREEFSNLRINLLRGIL
jgi:hypothetical protein